MSRKETVTLTQIGGERIGFVWRNISHFYCGAKTKLTYVCPITEDEIPVMETTTEVEQAIEQAASND